MREFFPTRLSIKRVAGYDQFGAPVMKGATVRGRVVLGSKTITTITGSEVVALGVVYTLSSIAANDRITYNSREYNVISTEPAVGLDGQIVYQKAYFK